MSETLRDLVVSLSLQTDNFTRNIRSVNRADRGGGEQVQTGPPQAWRALRRLPPA